ARCRSGAAGGSAATAVVGPGVNLPCETLLFAETEKFDGKERRDLEPWEIAQIAGRAGRFGFHERGHVCELTRLPKADPDPHLVHAALQQHGRIPPPPSSARRSSRTSRSRTATSATAWSTAAGCARSCPTSTSSASTSSSPRCT